MSIPFNPTLFSADPAGGSDHLRRLMLNPPKEFIESAAAQTAMAAARAPAPFSDGPITFGADGQAIMSPPPQGQAQGSWSQPVDTGEWQDPGTPGSGVHYASGMGMGVESHDQQGLDDGWMQQIQGQLAAGQPPIGDQGQTGQEQDQTVGIMTAPNDSASRATAPMAPATGTGTEAADLAAATSPATAVATAITASITSVIASISATPSIRTASMASISAPLTSATASISASLTSDPASASPSATDNIAASHKPFVKSTAFILIIVLCSLILIGIIATALRWAFRWKSKDGHDRYLGGMLHRHRRDPEADDLSDIVRHFNNGELEKRSSLLAEEMGHAPYLHSDDQLRPMRLDAHVAEEPMEDIDLDAPRAPALHETHGSPSMPCATQRLEVRNTDPDEYERSKTLPKSWVADRALANIANWPRPESVRSDSLTSDTSLPSPFSTKAASSAADDEWQRSASQCSSRVSTTDQPANWASTLRHSLFTAIGGKVEEDKYTRPVLPVHSRSLSRASTGRTLRSNRSSLRETQTFGRASGRGLVIEEEDDTYSMSSSAQGEMRQALMFDGRSSVGERYKAYARSLKES